MTDQDALLTKLAKSAKEGNEESFSRLIKILEPDIKKLASKFYLSGGDSEDVQQEYRIGVWKAVKDFNESMGMTFKNFALSLCCKRHIITAMSHANTQKFKLQNEAVSLSAPVSQSEDEGIQTWADYIIDPHFDLLEQYIIKEEFQTNFNMLADKLTNLEMSVFTQYAVDPAYKSIAGSLNIPVKSCDNSLLRVRLKAHYTYQYYLETHNLIGIETSIGAGSSILMGFSTAFGAGFSTEYFSCSFSTSGINTVFFV